MHKIFNNLTINIFPILNCQIISLYYIFNVRVNKNRANITRIRCPLWFVLSQLLVISIGNCKTDKCYVHSFTVQKFIIRIERKTSACVAFCDYLLWDKGIWNWLEAKQLQVEQKWQSCGVLESVVYSKMDSLIY